MQSPTRPTNIDEFIALAVKSGLRTDPELQAVRKSFRERIQSPFENLGAEMRGFCDFLVSSGRLTLWQCDMLLHGRFRGFFADFRFRLLHPVTRDETYLKFAAEEIQTKRQAVIRIMAPSAGLPEGRHPTFEIEEMYPPEP